MTHPHIKQFFDLIRPWMAAYDYSTLSFVALLYENEFVILAARLRLSSKPDRPLRRPLRTASLIAAEVPIAGNADAVVAFTNTALAGSPLVVGEHVLRFLQDEASGYSAYHDHASAPYRNWQRSSYLDCLRLGGARRWDLLNDRLTGLERELQPHGYRGLDSLMGEFDFEWSTSDMVTIGIVVDPILRISGESKILGQTAEISVHVPEQLGTDEVTLTVVDAGSDGRSFRRSIIGSELSWSRIDRDWVGTCVLDLPERTVLTCRALYAGSLHDEAELFDTAALPNLRRTIVELADPGLQRLGRPLTAPKNDQERNEFEPAVAVLLYMLGFDTVRVGGVKKLSDAADIYAGTPSGQLLVVECSTEVLDTKG